MFTTLLILLTALIPKHHACEYMMVSTFSVDIKWAVPCVTFSIDTYLSLYSRVNTIFYGYENRAE